MPKLLYFIVIFNSPFLSDKVSSKEWNLVTVPAGVTVTRSHDLTIATPSTDLPVFSSMTFPFQASNIAHSNRIKIIEKSTDKKWFYLMS